MAAAMSFVAEGVRSVRVSSGASRLCRSSMVFLELDFFMVSFVLVDVLSPRSNTFSVTDCGALLRRPYDGFFQFYSIIGHKHIIWFICWDG
jgi:hypothetical protein